VDQTPPLTTETPAPKVETPTLLNTEVPVETKPDPATGAPAAYEAFKVPEGFNLDPAVATEAGELFKSLNLSQKQAQSLIDFHAAKTAEAAEAPFKLWTETQKQWQDEVKADPEIGKKLPEVKTTVARAIDGLGDPKLAAEFRKAMDVTGAGNNPAFIRAFYKLAQKVTEGHIVTNGKPSPLGQTAPDAAPKSASGTFYPNL